MCNLCSDDPEEKRAAKEALLGVAHQFDAMADLVRRLSTGQIRPHDVEALRRNPAHSLIRYLVEEWL